MKKANVFFQWERRRSGRELSGLLCLILFRSLRVISPRRLDRHLSAQRDIIVFAPLGAPPSPKESCGQGYAAVGMIDEALRGIVALPPAARGDKYRALLAQLLAEATAAADGAPPTDGMRWVGPHAIFCVDEGGEGTPARFGGDGMGPCRGAEAFSLPGR